MKEKRIYMVTAEDCTGGLYDFQMHEVRQWDNEKFIEVAEIQGLVWTSLDSFIDWWNISGNSYGNLPDPRTSEIRYL